VGDMGRSIVLALPSARCLRVQLTEDSQAHFDINLTESTPKSYPILTKKTPSCQAWVSAAIFGPRVMSGAGRPGSPHGAFSIPAHIADITCYAEA
jgi:hypothetical protein